MIHPTPYGHDLRLLRRDGHTQIYRISRGCEVQAIQEIYNAYRWGRLSEHEAGQLLLGVNQLMARPKRESGFDRLVRLFCEVLGLGDEETCCGK